MDFSHPTKKDNRRQPVTFEFAVVYVYNKVDKKLNTIWNVSKWERI